MGASCPVQRTLLIWLCHFVKRLILFELVAWLLAWQLFRHRLKFISKFICQMLYHWICFGHVISWHSWSSLISEVLARSSLRWSSNVKLFLFFFFSLQAHQLEKFLLVLESRVQSWRNVFETCGSMHSLPYQAFFVRIINLVYQILILRSECLSCLLLCFYLML